MVSEDKWVIGVSGRAAAISLSAILAAALPGSAFATQHAVSLAPAASGELTVPPLKIHELVSLLADPEVEQWLKQQNEVSRLPHRGGTLQRIGSVRPLFPLRCDP